MPMSWVSANEAISKWLGLLYPQLSVIELRTPPSPMKGGVCGVLRDFHHKLVTNTRLCVSPAETAVFEEWSRKPSYDGDLMCS